MQAKIKNNSIQQKCAFIINETNGLSGGQLVIDFPTCLNKKLMSITLPDDDLLNNVLKIVTLPPQLISIDVDGRSMPINVKDGKKKKMKMRGI